MSIVRRVRAFLLASASVAALWAGRLDAQAAGAAPAPSQTPTVVDDRGVVSLTAMGFGFWQTDRGYDFGAPFGTFSPLHGLGGGLGIAYQPALSPWSFGINARYGATSKKTKSIATTSTASPVLFEGSR